MGRSGDPGTVQTKPWEWWAPGFSEESGARGQGLGMGGNEQIQILETSAQVAHQTPEGETRSNPVDRGSLAPVLLLVTEFLLKGFLKIAT